MPPPVQAASGSSHPFRAPVWMLLSGVLMGLSLPPAGLYPLAWLALVPLVVRWLHSPSPWLSFGDAYAAFLAMSVVGGYWSLLHEEPAQAMSAGVLLLVLPSLMGLPFMLGWVVRQRVGPVLGFAALAASALVMEHVIGGWAIPLPWAQVGHTQLASLTLLQAADLSGVSALSAWLWIVGGLGAWVVVTESYVWPVFTNRTVALLVLAIAFMLPFLYGTYRLERISPDVRGLRIGLVQPSLPPQQWLHSDPAARIDHLASLSTSLLKHGGAPVASAEAGFSAPYPSRPHTIDVVVWPELALPVYADVSRTERLYRRVNAWAQTQQVTLLAGAATLPDGTTPAAATQRFNSALLFDAEGALQRSDQTRIHRAFDGARFVEPPTEVPQTQPHWRIAQAEQPFAAASDKQPLRLPKGRLGTLIGFEALFSQEARSLVRQGADVLMVLSQDDWWGTQTASDMHFALAQLRAVETRRPVVVSTVNGATGVVEPSGASQKYDATEQPIGAYRVLLSASEAAYVRYGNVVLSGSWLLLVLVSIAYAARTLRPHRPNKADPVHPPADDNEFVSSRKGGLAWPEESTAYDDLVLDQEDLNALPSFGALSHAPYAAIEEPSVQAPPMPPVNSFQERLAAPSPFLGDGGFEGNTPSAPSVTQAAASPPPEDNPWYASPSPSSSPPAPPADADSSAPWASPSRFTSPVTPKTSPPTSRPETP
ncbi:MAG: apolipoprotein N-acyltransferase [Bacteroidota bacterium]